MMASSRMPKSIRKVQNEIGVEWPFVAYDGAKAEIDGTQGILIDHRMPAGLVEEVTGEAKASGAHVGLFVDDEWFVEDIDYWALREVRGTGVWPKVTPLSMLFGRGTHSDKGFHKIMIRGETVNLQKLSDSIDIKFSPSFMMNFNGKTTLELVSSSAGKWKAIEIFLTSRNIDRNKTMAFGDGKNDLELLKNVGKGIAMDNSSNEIKNVSSETTLTNDEDGVAFMLQRYFGYLT